MARSTNIPSRRSTTATTTAMSSLNSRAATSRPSGLPEPLDEGGVGHAAALAHGLEAPAAAAAFELAHERGEQPGTRATEGVAEGDGTAVDVDLVHVGVVLLLPGQHHRGEGLVDLGQV